MNERIRELAEQATTIEVLSGRGFDETQYTERFNKEKFAELIVAECIDIVDSHRMKMDSGPTHIIEDFKQHFGVE